MSDVVVARNRDPLDRVQVILPQGGNVRSILAARSHVPFAPSVLEFVEALGQSLLRDPAVRRHPELVALGFWARGANIRRLRARFDDAYPDAVRMPRGRCLHIAPANVDTIFVYSLLLSMLAGNVNLVRVSSRSGEQANLLLQTFADCLAEADPAVRSATGIIRYDHDKEITDALSAEIALRIIWGGDASVKLIRESPLSPTGSDLVFPNKFSIAVLDANAWITLDDKSRIADAFVSDSYWFGQMACSSPRAVVWRGSEREMAIASDVFWDSVEDAVDRADPEWTAAMSVSKLRAEHEAAIDSQCDKILPTRSNRVRVIRCGLNRLEGKNVGGGFFREALVKSIAELTELSAPHWQTISSFGIADEDWKSAIKATVPLGIDRVVPFGKSLDFNSLWDGKDLIVAMTRITIVN